MSVKASQIARFLERPLVGDDVVVIQPRSLDAIGPQSLIFTTRFSDEILESINSAADIAVIASKEFEGRLSVSHIISDNPRLDFALTLKEFFRPAPNRTIAKSAIISQSARLGKDVAVGAFSVIGENVQIGPDTEVAHHVVITDNCVVGARCLIKSHAVIGGKGYGFEYDEAGTPIPLTHLGRVVIGDDVEIGALSSINRGTLDDTVIGNSVKIDDHVFLAHNVQVGENSLIIAHAEVSGSVRIGKNVWIGPNACVLNGIEIGDEALIGLGAVVIRDVKARSRMAGNPAKVIGEQPARFPSA